MEDTEYLLQKRYIMDLKKPDISPFKRARIIKEVIAREKLSGRGFAKKYGFKWSTLEDWLLWLNITEKEYNKLKKQGFTRTHIYRTLRNNRTAKQRITVMLKTKTEFDLKLEHITKLVHTRANTVEPDLSERTIEMLKQLKKEINRLLFRYEKAMRLV